MLSAREKHLATESDTVELGRRLGALLEPGLVFYLEGGLGAGKTTLARGILAALGHTGAVKSPTYTLVEPYEALRPPVYHFDLYRLGDPEELEFLGVRDYFDGRGVCLVEWPDRGTGILPPPDLRVALLARGDSRRAALSVSGDRGSALLAVLEKPEVAPG